jgi:hypothetical protein
MRANLARNTRKIKIKTFAERIRLWTRISRLPSLSILSEMCRSYRQSGPPSDGLVLWRLRTRSSPRAVRGSIAKIDWSRVGILGFYQNRVAGFPRRMRKTLPPPAVKFAPCEPRFLLSKRSKMIKAQSRLLRRGSGLLDDGSRWISIIEHCVQPRQGTTLRMDEFT